MAYEVTLITGDGVGPELAEAARKCVDATGVAINWDVQEAGIDVMEKTGNPLPPEVLESIRRTRCALQTAGWRAITDRPYGEREPELAAVRADTWVRPYGEAERIVGAGPCPARPVARRSPQLGVRKPDLP